MLNFDLFLEEIEVNILKENLTHVAFATGVSRETLVNCFRENFRIPRLVTLSKVLVFLDWKLKISSKAFKKEYVSFDIEAIAKQAMRETPAVLSHSFDDPSMLTMAYRLRSDKLCPSLYTVFSLLGQLGYTFEFVKPSY